MSKGRYPQCPKCERPIIRKMAPGSDLYYCEHCKEFFAHKRIVVWIERTESKGGVVAGHTFARQYAGWGGLRR